MPENSVPNETIDVRKLFERALVLSKQNTFTLFQGLVVILAVTMIFSVYVVNTFNISSIEDIQKIEDPSFSLAFFFYTLIISPMWAGILMMSLTSARKLKPSPFQIFQYFKFLPALGLVAVVIDLLTQIGLMLLVLPAFYVYMVSTFIVPLITDKQLGPLKAAILSVKMTHQHFNKIALLYLIFFGLMLAGFASLGLGFIWILPYIHNVKAILYQDLFCKTLTTEINRPETTGVFDA
ncbi:hypothetical protein [Glaciecola sp. 1036]|uniref:hypothetical protein n=1 Tax=Alteromonadaceae TaxID=72275 RepID=UPI003D00788D